jgi:hypothetical protein
MIRFIVAAVWLCAVTVGAVFYSFQAAGSKTTAEPAPPFLGGLDYVKMDVLSIPLIREGRVDGYFLTRLVYTVEPKKITQLTVPLQTLLTDHTYSYVYASPETDFSKKAAFDVEAFRNGLRDSVNARLGVPLIHDVLVEQVDYLSKEDIRDNTIRRRTAPARNR